MSNLKIRLTGALLTLGTLAVVLSAVPLRGGYWGGV